MGSLIENPYHKKGITGHNYNDPARCNPAPGQRVKQGKGSNHSRISERYGLANYWCPECGKGPTGCTCTAPTGMEPLPEEGEEEDDIWDAVAKYRQDHPVIETLPWYKATDGQRTTNAAGWMNYCLEAEADLGRLRKDLEKSQKALTHLQKWVKNRQFY